MNTTVRMILPILFAGCMAVCGLLAPATVLANPLADLQLRNYRQVTDDLAGQVVSKLPDDIHFRLLAIGGIVGDDGALEAALMARIKSDTRYHLIERGDLDKLLNEQGIQLSAVADPRQPVAPGRIKGVEGLLMGKVGARHCSPLYCSMEVFLKLDNVEGGDVVFARSFSARFVPPTTIYGGLACIILILLIIGVTQRNRQQMRKAQRKVAQENKALLSLQGELKAIHDNLNRAHDGLVAADRMPQAMAVKAARGDADTLSQRIAQAPEMNLDDAKDKRAVKTAEELAKSLAGFMKNIRAESENLLKVSVSREAGAVDKAITALETEIKNAANRFHQRTAGRS